MENMEIHKYYKEETKTLKVNLSLIISVTLNTNELSTPIKGQ